MAETTADVRRDIELTRARMSDTLQELERKMNVAQIVKNNPWPALALAVGAGVLLSERPRGDGTRRPRCAVGRRCAGRDRVAHRRDGERREARDWRAGDATQLRDDAEYGPRRQRAPR